MFPLFREVPIYCDMKPRGGERGCDVTKCVSTFSYLWISFPFLVLEDPSSTEMPDSIFHQ